MGSPWGVMCLPPAAIGGEDDGGASRPGSAGERVAVPPPRVRGCATPCVTGALYFSLNRTTTSDVVSVITTTSCRRRGDLARPGPVEKAEDAPLSVGLYTSPLYCRSHLSGEARKARNAALASERRAFMDKLVERRTRKAALEAYAAVKIQAALRGIHRRVACPPDEVARESAVRKRCRAAILDQLAATTGWALTRRTMKESYLIHRAGGALNIQNALRKRTARKTANDRRRDRAASVLQDRCRSRGGGAAYEIRATAIVAPALAAELIQTVYRRHAATMRVLWRRIRLRAIAALVIESAARSYRARVRVADTRARKARAAAE